MHILKRNGLARTCLMLSASIAVLAMASCGGSDLPAEVGTGGGTPPGGGTAATKSFSITPTVSGFGGSAATTSAGSIGRTKSKTTRGLAENREEPESRAGIKLGARSTKRATKAGTGEPGTGSGSNGNDLVDLNGNNLFVSGLTTAQLAATLTFKAQGTGASLGSITLAGAQVTNNSVQLSGTALGAGQNLLVEISVLGGISTAIVPSTFFANGGSYGFNIVRRPDASMIIELFPDTLAPFGSSDNGSRIVIDTAVDAMKNGVFVTVARFESPDGLVLFDSNLDGIFGSSSDEVILIDTNRDGLIDNKDTPVSYAVDPNLDGVSAPEETRLLGNNVPEDFINSAVVTLSPTEVIGNGLSIISVKTRIDPAFDGNPIGSTISYSIELASGTLADNVQGGAGARFAANGQTTLQRTIDPISPSVRILAGGVIEITDAVRAPIMTTDGELRVTASYLTSTSTSARQIPATVVVKKNTAPTLAQVNFVGTIANNPNLSGLAAVSQAARVVEGATFQIVGTNFATDIASIRLTVGGVTAVVTSVNSAGTELFAIVPQGALTGPIAVIQGTVGAATTEDFVIAGPAVAVESVLPAANATNVGLNGSVSVRFNQPIATASIENGFRLRTQAGTPVPGTATVSEDGRTVTFTPSAAMAASTVHEVVLLGLLEAANGARFDRDVTNDQVASAEPELIIASFTTGASAGSDTTPPGLVNAVLAPPATARDPWILTIELSEGVNPGTVVTSSPALATDKLILSQGNGSDLANAAKIGMSVSYSGTEGQILTCRLLEAPLGRATYTLTIGAGVSDSSANAIVTPITQSFNTLLRVDSLSKISGPTGSQIVIDGSTFDELASNVSVTFNSEAGPIAAQIVDTSALDITVVVPTGATDGVVSVTVAGQTAVSPRPFTVTSAGFTPRIIATGAGAFGLAVDFNDVALVSFQESGELGLIDLSTEQPIDVNPTNPNVERLTVGGVPTTAVLDGTGTIGFTTNYGSVTTPGSTVFVLDMLTRTLKAAIPVGERPARIAVSPDNRRAYVTNFLSDSVSVIDIESLSVTATIPVGVGPNGISISADNQRGYVCNFLDGTVTVFEVQSLLPVATIAVGNNPARTLVSGDSTTLFVSNFGGDSISVINAATQAPIQTITGIGGPSSMVFASGENRLWVTGRLQNIIQEVVKGQNGQWALGEVRIAVGDTPASISLTYDGALLAYTCEGSGEVGVVTVGDPQPVVTGFSVDENDRPGRATFSVDRRQPLWVRGRGFGSTASELNITLDGVTLPILNSPFNTRKQIKVDIGPEARSGSVKVARSLTASDVRTSNSLPLLITRKNPTVVSVTPGDGTSGVATSTRVVIDFSEPINPSTVFSESGLVRIVGGARVMRVVRRDDNVIGAEAEIAGTWRGGAQGFRFEFTPSGAEPFLLAGSNNNYEIIVSTSVQDLFGNSVVGSSTTFASSTDTSVGATATSGVLAASLGFRSRFQSQDLLGPRIVEAVYRDIDNNGVSPGDQLEVRFDEELFYVLANFDVSAGLSLSAGTLGTGVQATLGRSPRHLLITLGLGANFALGTASINVVPNSITEIRDYNGNSPAANATGVAISLDPASDNQDNPNLLAAYVIDLDAIPGVSAGDELRLTFNEPVFRGSVAINGSPSAFINLSDGRTLGSSTFIIRGVGDDRRTLRILLAGDATIEAGGTTPTQLSLKAGTTPIPSGQLAMNPGEFEDLLGNPAYAGLDTSRPVGLGLPGPAALLNDALVRPVFFDLVGTLEGLSEGDAIVLPYSGPVFFNALAGGGNVRPADMFDLGVTGDRFGQGARLAQPAVITYRSGTGTAVRRIQPNEIVIILGVEPVFNFEGTFGPTGSPASSGRGK